MKYLAVILLSLPFVIGSCKPDEGINGDCYVPNVAVNLTVNMDLPDYYNLRNLGEYKEFDAGHRGIYLIHNYDDFFYAIERTCTYQSENECAQIYLDDDILQLKCGTQADTGFVKCCSSTYAFNSAFLTGPTLCNLRTYRVNRSGNTLYISN
ncbi:MAG: hypothetical protein ACPGTP_00630 [Bacteroidia bacterium]